MKIKYIAHSTVLVEDKGVKILCDPWLEGETYYGSWAHYPPVDFSPEEYADIDYIYISHIHPDHLHHPTLKELDSDIPVFIHDFKWDYVKKNIERMGFDVNELSHGERHHLEGDLHLSIYASDDCNPEVCQKLFGCTWFGEDKAGEKKATEGSTYIDTMGVFDNEEEVLVNANDCRWPFTQRAARRVKRTFNGINCLLVQAGSAGIYPHFMINLSHEKMLSERERIIKESMEDVLGFVRTLSPDVVIPFASSVVLAGNLAERNLYHPTPSFSEAEKYYQDIAGESVQDATEMVLLNQGNFFDITTKEKSSEYEPIDKEKKWEYIRNELQERSYEYESEKYRHLRNSIIYLKVPSKTSTKNA
ncbi:MBL fold metallo-hydrolase [Haladaptatus sp. F3-133]|uniref:MBL fold metallo-hydrolase n=1 Tax=Halorutilus salinus TaxID=2487751 RepID=A0A9Q4C3X0_9EURY|nr:MBL fold metallo-hydrolase [Halorutilus salinus]